MFLAELGAGFCRTVFINRINSFPNSEAGAGSICVTSSAKKNIKPWHFFSTSSVCFVICRQVSACSSVFCLHLQRINAS